MNAPNSYPLTIGLDARAVHRAARRGTGKNLIDLYTEVLRLRPDWTVVGYHRGPEPRPIDNDRYQPRWIDARGDRIDVWRRWRLPAAAWADRLDLLHCPANLMPPWSPCPTLTTIHDLMPLDGPPRLARAMAGSIRRCVRTGSTIITPSRFTADALVERFNADPSQIVVNHWAADRGMRYIDIGPARTEACGRYGADRPFILHLGAPDPRKNTVNVIEAYAMLSAELREQWPLVIVGLDNEAHREAMADLCAQRDVARTVHLNGFADEADMPALFSAAEVLLYPSRWEGFGLPILDAWTAQTAVVCSGTTSLPEVGGHAAAYVDPERPDDIADRLGRVLQDDKLRRELQRAGVTRVARFTWPNTAERFIGAVEHALQRNGRPSRAAA